MSHEWVPRGYAVEQLLGSGSTADVWRARIEASGEAVALKRIHLGADGEHEGGRRALPTRAQRVARAESEARLLASLDHPNLIRLHDALHTHDSLVLVLDLAERGCLRDLLAARGRLSPGEVITALAPTAAAVAHLHERSVVHGDVSAANVLFSAAGEPLLADVGVARLVGEDRIVESTPVYADPAVAAGRAPVCASDVFMLGALAFHALTGEPLWKAGDGSPIATLARAVGGVPRDLLAQLAAAGVPDATADVLARALVDDPAARCSAVEFAMDLRHSTPASAVDFDAGRESPVPDGPRFGSLDTGARDAVEECDGFEVGSYPPIPVVAAPGRPEFARPAEVVRVPAEPPTRVVVPRARPQLPRGALRRRPVAAPPPAVRRASGRHRSGPSGRGRRAGALVAAAVVLAGLAGGLALLATGGSSSLAGPAPARHASSHPATSPPSHPVTSPPSHSVTSPPSHPATSARSRPAPPRTSPVPSLPTSVANGVAAWKRVLERVDHLRASAYAQGRPELLSQVYSSTGLQRSDASRLRVTVPPGCGLHGLRTDYQVLDVAVSGRSARLLVVARLSASTLVCDGALRATAAASGPVRLRVVVAELGAGPRIAELRSA